MRASDTLLTTTIVLQNKISISNSYRLRYTSVRERLFTAFNGNVRRVSLPHLFYTDSLSTTAFTRIVQELLLQFASTSLCFSHFEPIIIGVCMRRIDCNEVPVLRCN